MGEATDHERSHENWPDTDLETVTVCPACHGPKHNILFDGLEDRIFFCAPGLWTSWQCQDCYSLFINPRPTVRSVGRAYEHYFTHSKDESDLTTSLVASARRAIGNGYRNGRFGTNYAGAWPFGKFVVPLLPKLRQQIDLSFRFLPKPIATGRRVMDVGCGNGSFLRLAADAGWHTAGVEPDPQARAVASSEGADVRPSLDDWQSEVGSFGYLSMSHVLEHLHYPTETLEKCFELLEPGGMIFIDTPSASARGLAAYGSNWVALDPPRHLVLFNRSSLAKILKNAGFIGLEWIPRPFAHIGTALQSERIAKALNPFDGTPTELQTPKIQSCAHLAPSSDTEEYLTLVARKPS